MRRPRSLRLTLLLANALLPAALWAQTMDPLGLVPEAVSAAEPMGLRLEATATHNTWRWAPPGARDTGVHWVADFRREWQLDERWRIGLSDRWEHVSQPGTDAERNALREMWVSLQTGDNSYADMGRLHWRNGVAQGFNPTDYLKRGATLDLGSQDPLAVRENRLGTAMARHQWLGAWGSLQAAFIPRLSRATNSSATSPAWEKTNGAEAALIKFAATLDERTSIDVLAYTRAHELPRWGGNVTRLVGDALVLYAEGSYQRGAPDSALGAQWTHRANITVNAEHHRDGASGRQAFYVRASWGDAFDVQDLDIAAFVRRDREDRSRLWQVDLAWALSDQWSLRAAYGGYDGTSHSLFGSVPVRRYALAGVSVTF